jgi:hypothetical protein
MVTNHQVTLSGLAAGTTYYYQVSSTDSKSNNGHSGGHGFKTSGFGISGAINPAATGGSGATLALSGPASVTATADSAGNYTFSGLPNGTYTVAPNHTGYTFTPSSQNATVNGSNVSGLNFTASASTSAPTITAQPVSQAVTAGQAAGFTVVAAGTAPLSYQWQKNGVSIGGATSASYTTPTTTTSDNGATFRVVVSNAAGTVTSAAATLTVNAAAVPPTITVQPVSQTVTAGQTASFVVAATGTAPLTYQWQKSGVNIAGANSTSYTTPATTTSDNGVTFRVVVSNTAGTATSAAATLTVNAAAVAPAIAAQPVNQTVTAGQAAGFSVAATGTAPLSYQWQKSGVNIAGANSASYTTPATTPSDNGATFRVVVSNAAGTVTSAAATLTVNAAVVAPAITTQPVSQAVVAGQTASFSVTATGTGPLSYQWQKSGANVAGATSASYTTPVTTTSDNGATFRVVVSNTAGTATSAAATVTVTAAAVAPTISTQPVNQTVTAGQTASFVVVATGMAPLSYQWQKNGANIAGATTPSYTTPGTISSDSGSTFRVVVSNAAGTVTSAPATLTVRAPAIQVNSTSVNFGSSVVGAGLSQVLIVTNTGTATLTITQVSETGSSAFSVSGLTLPVTVTAGNQTTITLNFLPASVGLATGNISIVSDAPTSPTSVALNGTGTAATFTLGISPTSLSFGNITTGASSATQTVTVTNTGNSNVTISQINLTGQEYSMTGGGTPATLSPTQSIHLVVKFSPTLTGNVTGSISIVSNASGSPATVSLQGTGVIQHSAGLTWNATVSTVSGYRVYRSTVSGGAYAMISSSSLVASLSYTDSTVQSGATYYYVTTAVDAAGNESIFSNEVKAVIP